MGCGAILNANEKRQWDLKKGFLLAFSIVSYMRWGVAYGCAHA